MMRFLANLIGIGRATVVDDSGEMQLIQVTEGALGTGFEDRVTDNVRRVTEFGFSCNPPIDSEVTVLRRGGERTCGVVIATSHRPSRPRNLKVGDTQVYDVRGALIWFSEDGIIIDAAGSDVMIQNADTVTVKATTKVRLETPTLEVTGDVKVGGDVVSRSGGTPVSLSGLRDAYHAHKHAGVTTGTGVSGLTDHDA